jgi:hypothetical protein
MKYHLLIIFSIVAGFAIAKSQRPTTKENQKLAQEYLMVRSHIKVKPVDAKIYIFKKDIKKKYYKKQKLKVEHYDLY